MSSTAGGPLCAPLTPNAAKPRPPAVTRVRAEPAQRSATGDPVALLVAALWANLSALADPGVAAGQQSYMKTAEPYLGIRAPVVRTTVNTLVRAAPLLPRQDWERAVRELYSKATHREHRYAALELARHRRYILFRDGAIAPLVHDVVTGGQWWDLVDSAAHVLGDGLVADRAAGGTDLTRIVANWAIESDVWLRRVAVISQLGHRGDTDLGLLEHCLDAQLGRSEFWLRKASGWALRELSHSNPAWVLGYLAERADAVAPLTRREALKAITRAT